MIDMKEFIEDSQDTTKEEISDTASEAESIDETPELDVQKVVVEELATEKVKLENEIAELRVKLAGKDGEIAKLRAELRASEKNLQEKDELLKAKDEELEIKFEKDYNTQERNPNSLALLDRDVEIPDRFPGETRDHLLEVIKEARDIAEGTGRHRKAQVLEGVLIANEPNGTLARKRAELEKIFESNGNIISGEVIAQLDSMGISYKSGEEYLMPREIIDKAY